MAGEKFKMFLPHRGVPALACTLLLSGCATLLAPRHPSPTPALPSEPATSGAYGLVANAGTLDERLRPSAHLAPRARRGGWASLPISRGRTLRPEFYLDGAVPWAVAVAVVSFRDDAEVLPALAVAVSSAMVVDLLTGAAWDNRSAPPPLPRVSLPPPLPLPPTSQPQRDMDAEIAADPALASIAATLLLRQMAEAADRAGCNRAVSQAWLDDGDHVRRAGTVSPADSSAVDARVRRDVAMAEAELRRLCARSNPLMDSLASIQTRHEAGATQAEATSVKTEADAAPGPAELCRAEAFGHCITFDVASSDIAPRFDAALDQAAERIRALRLPVLIVVVGTADLLGDGALNQRLGLARATAVRDALVRRGVPPGWLLVESCGEPRCHLVPGAAGGMPGAELNRRVIFMLRLKETTP